jgi:hypothetical protein
LFETWSTDKKVTCVYEKDIHVSHKGQGAATHREKGQGVTRTRAGAAPCNNGLARTLLKVQVLGKNCRLRTGNRHMSSLYRYIVCLHDKIYLYRDVLISSTHSIKDSHLFWLYLCIVFITGICMKIELHQSNQTRSTTFWTLNGCKYSSYFIPFCNLQYMYYA